MRNTLHRVRISEETGTSRPRCTSASKTNTLGSRIPQDHAAVQCRDLSFVLSSSLRYVSSMRFARIAEFQRTRARVLWLPRTLSIVSSPWYSSQPFSKTKRESQIAPVVPAPPRDHAARLMNHAHHRAAFFFHERERMRALSLSLSPTRARERRCETPSRGPPKGGFLAIRRPAPSSARARSERTTWPPTTASRSRFRRLRVGTG